MSTDWAWLIELDGLTFGRCANGELKTVTFSDPTAMRFKQQGDAEMEMRQLETRFSWMKGRLTVREHAFVNIPAATNAMPKFDKVYCSQCGREFGPGNHGYSHCKDHGGSVYPVEPATQSGLNNLPKRYRGGRFTYDFNEQQNRFEIYTNGFCVAETEDSEVADAICKLFNDAVKYSQTGISELARND